MQQVTPMMVPLVLFRLSRMLAFLFSVQDLNAQWKKGTQTEKMTFQASTEKDRCSLLNPDNTRKSFTVAVFPLPDQEQ